MINGICKGGPADGKQYFLDGNILKIDVWPDRYDYPSAENVSQPYDDKIKIDTCFYEKEPIADGFQRGYRWVYQGPI